MARQQKTPWVGRKRSPTNLRLQRLPGAAQQLPCAHQDLRPFHGTKTCFSTPKRSFRTQKPHLTGKMNQYLQDLSIWFS